MFNVENTCMVRTKYNCKGSFFLMAFYLIKKSMSDSQLHSWNFNLINNCNIKFVFFTWQVLNSVKFCIVSEEKYLAYHCFTETENENI